MTPPPTVLGLTLCDYLIVEQGTKKVSLIGCFSGLRADTFPTPPRSFYVFAGLTSGLGEATITIEVNDLTADRLVYTNSQRARFTDRLAELQASFRVTQCSFPSP